MTFSMTLTYTCIWTYLSLKSFKPSTMQKRKHNLIALAAQAKDMNAKLNESYAANRLTKKQTQSKYGKLSGSSHPNGRVVVNVV